METLSLFDILLMIQSSNPSRVVVFNYEDLRYILCDKLEDKFPNWKQVEIENIEGKDFLTITSDYIYYILANEQTRKFFSI